MDFTADQIGAYLIALGNIMRAHGVGAPTVVGEDRDGNSEADFLTMMEEAGIEPDVAQALIQADPASLILTIPGVGE